ncbi:MAG: hypothetical protein WB511_07865 [Nitrososphaeraceae archaeon]
MTEESKNSNHRKFTIGRLILLSSLVAAIISIPAIFVTLLTHYILHLKLSITLMTGIVTLFLALGIGYKVSKKLSKI